MLTKKAIVSFAAGATLLSGFAFAVVPQTAFAVSNTTSTSAEHNDNDVIHFKNEIFKKNILGALKDYQVIGKDATDITYADAKKMVYPVFLDLGYSYNKPEGVDVDPQSSDKNVSDLSDLQYFSNVQDLHLTGDVGFDFSPLAKLQNLTKLYIMIRNSTKTCDFSSLKGVTKNLTTLSVRVSGDPDLSPLERFTNLTDLDIDANYLKSLDAIKGLTKLEHLVLHASSVSDLSPLKNLTNLTDLGIYSSAATNIDALKGLTKLKDLWLYIWDAPDLSPLKNLTDVTNLHVVTNKATSVDALKGLTKLKKLEMQIHNVSDISPLGNLKNLTFLDISDSIVKDISTIKQIPYLSYLDITCCDKIGDYSPLKSLPGNAVLVVSAKLKDSDVIKKLKQERGDKKIDISYSTTWCSQGCDPDFNDVKHIEPDSNDDKDIEPADNHGDANTSTVDIKEPEDAKDSSKDSSKDYGDDNPQFAADFDDFDLDLSDPGLLYDDSSSDYGDDNQQFAADFDDFDFDLDLSDPGLLYDDSSSDYGDDNPQSAVNFDDKFMSFDSNFDDFDIAELDNLADFSNDIGDFYDVDVSAHNSLDSNQVEPVTADAVSNAEPAAEPAAM